jgi:hypothetical protein
MASLTSVLTIKFDPDDRELLERVVSALDRGSASLSTDPAPVTMDEGGDGEEEAPISPSGALAEIAKYLGVEADAACVVQAVKDLGSDCQDLRQSAAREVVHLASTPFRPRCGADVPGQRTVDQASPMVLRGGETTVCPACVAVVLEEHTP